MVKNKYRSYSRQIKNLKRRGNLRKYRITPLKKGGTVTKLAKAKKKDYIFDIDKLTKPKPHEKLKKDEGKTSQRRTNFGQGYP